MSGFTEALVCAEPAVRSDYLVIVRRGAESTYQYLKERLAGVRGVEVTLDRRQTTARPSGTERRRASSLYFNAFGVLLVRRPPRSLLIR